MSTQPSKGGTAKPALKHAPAAKKPPAKGRTLRLNGSAEVIVLDDGADAKGGSGGKAEAAAAAAEKVQALAEGLLDQDDGLVQGETFKEYMPAKLKIGFRHPDHIVETTSLGSVAPPDVKYKLQLPAEIIEKGLLSAPQLESITYACQQHDTYLHDKGKRAGYLLGDGAGVGKGRTVAGIVYENYVRGRNKAIWFSISPDLKYDAERDLKDIGASHIKVFRTDEFPYSRSIDKKAGVLFATYSALIGRRTAKNSRFTSRIEQMVDWCGEGFDGVIIFDECHRAKNLIPATAKAKATKTGIAVAYIQEKLAGARIVYASATGASEPCNMGYMSRLGLWGEGTGFDTFHAFKNSIERRGVGAMELVAMEMKHRGMYIARQLSFSGVSFNVVDVRLKEEFRHLYDRCVEFWVMADKEFRDAAVIAKLGKKKRFVMSTQFWCAHQRFFKYLCLSAKVAAAVKYATDAVKAGKCAVIGLQSTGEAKTDQLREVLEANGEELTDFISTSRAVFMGVLKMFPVDLDDEDDTKKTKKFNFIVDDDGSNDSEDDEQMDFDLEREDLLAAQSLNRKLARSGKSEIQRILEKKRDVLLSDFETFSDDLPPNTLDELIHQLGGAHLVAEMTGRKGRMLSQDGRIFYEQRKESIDVDSLNIAEKNQFMNGEKLIAIISEAASSGISLQADRRVINQRRRVHITLELAWSADRAIQQFGRTHRSNQTCPPEYVFLISDVAGEKRFASVVAKRLERLGALTHGDRRVTETRDLSMFNIDTKHGRFALSNMMKVFTRRDYTPVVPLPSNYPGAFVEDAQKGFLSVGIVENVPSSAGYRIPFSFSMDRFMNRILGMSVNLQNAVFQYFVDTLDHVIEEAKKNGKFELGTMELGKTDAEAKLEKRVFFQQQDKEHSTTYVYTVSADRGLSFAQAEKLLQENAGNNNNGFYTTNFQLPNQARPYILLAIAAVGATGFGNRNNSFDLYKPNSGRGLVRNTFEQLIEKHTKVTNRGRAEQLWTTMYTMTTNACIHKYVHGTTCRTSDCTVGMRTRRDHVLSGSVLSIWKQLESVFDGKSANAVRRMQIVRVIFKHRRVIGIMLPHAGYEIIMEAIKDEHGTPIDDTAAAVVEMAQAPEITQFRAAPPQPIQALPNSMMASKKVPSSFAQSSRNAAPRRYIRKAVKLPSESQSDNPSKVSDGDLSEPSSSEAEEDSSSPKKVSKFTARSSRRSTSEEFAPPRKMGAKYKPTALRHISGSSDESSSDEYSPSEKQTKTKTVDPELQLDSIRIFSSDDEKIPQVAKPKATKDVFLSSSEDDSMQSMSEPNTGEASEDGDTPSMPELKQPVAVESVSLKMPVGAVQGKLGLSVIPRKPVAGAPVNLLETSIEIPFPMILVISDEEKEIPFSKTVGVPKKKIVTLSSGDEADRRNHRSSEMGALNHGEVGNMHRKENGLERSSLGNRSPSLHYRMTEPKPDVLSPLHDNDGEYRKANSSSLLAMNKPTGFGGAETMKPGEDTDVIIIRGLKRVLSNSS